MRRPKHTGPYQFKPTPIPDGFTLVIDTREQHPLFQSPPAGLDIISKALSDGDYSILGFEDEVFVERKCDDLYPYIGRDRKRTEEKLERIALFGFRALIIELDDPFQVPMNTQITPEMVRGFLKACRVKYGIHVYWSKHRDDLERFILDHLTYYFKQLRKARRA